MRDFITVRGFTFMSLNRALGLLRALWCATTGKFTKPSSGTLYRFR